MIGYASGDQAVDLNVNLTFNVSDPELTKETTVTTDIYVVPAPPAPQPPQPFHNPAVIDLNDEIVILDEEVPLADVPETGDPSVIMAVISTLSGLGLAGLQLTKKRQER